MVGVTGPVGGTCFGVFLLLPHLKGIPHANVLDPSKVARPAVWVLPVMEWSVFVVVVIWMLTVSISLAAKRLRPK